MLRGSDAYGSSQRCNRYAQSFAHATAMDQKAPASLKSLIKIGLKNPSRPGEVSKAQQSIKPQSQSSPRRRLEGSPASLNR